MRQRTGIADTLRDLAVEQFATVEKRLVHGGSLQARRLSSGDIVWYWRASRDGKTFRERIGVADLTAPPKALEPTRKGYGFAAALEACRKLAEVHKAHAGGLRGLKADQAEAESAKQRDRVERSERSLGALLDVYVEHLRARGRSSAIDAANIFSLHVRGAFPKLAAKPAADVTVDDCLDLLRRLVQLGKARTGNKLRAFVRAAYQCALDVRVDPKLPSAFRGFGITSNPAALTKRDAAADRADKRPLSLAELRTYWTRIRDLGGLAGAALRLHLLLGAPRIEQLLRLHVRSIRDDALVLYDLKGRPGHGARPHLLPITDEVREALDVLPLAGEFALSTTDGAKPISARTFTTYAHAAVGDAVAEFTPKRLRSGVETTLSQHGISRDTRAVLQSHGRSGVQQKHYDDSDQLPAMRAALALLLNLLDAPASPVVVPIRKGRAKPLG